MIAVVCGCKCRTEKEDREPLPRQEVRDACGRTGANAHPSFLHQREEARGGHDESCDEGSGTTLKTTSA